jgi:hypothetical protein
LTTGGSVLVFGGSITAASVFAVVGFGVGAMELRLAQRRSHAARTAGGASAT